MITLFVTALQRRCPLELGWALRSLSHRIPPNRINKGRDLLIDFADAKLLWAALYRSLNPMNTEDYEHRRLSIHEISGRCDGLTMRNKRLISDDLVAREGAEPSMPAFSGLYSLGLNPFSVNNLIRQGGHFIVTSAAVRLSVG